MVSQYVADPYSPRRRRTREVRVGNVVIGGDQPIRLQSMTTTDTLDTAATVEQAAALAHAGCEIIRVTAPSIRDAENLANIKSELLARGIETPLVADIHFTPNAALEAALHVEKVRINPGNFADKKKFDVREYSDAEYREELERVGERFRPLVLRCKELGRAMRIGTNHGSLSDRIMNRFGDTAEGMVESALEFLDVCEAHEYRDVVFSMKASNAKVAICAYRMLAARLEERAPGVPSYPFHIGVTEAGDAEDGRIKSAIGIGALLADGIGDTVRVSLTEHPVAEVPVADALARQAEARFALAPAAVGDPGAPWVADPLAPVRRIARSLGTGDSALGGDHPVRVELELGALPQAPAAMAQELAASLGRIREVACEGLLIEVYDPAGREGLEQFKAALVEAGIELPLAVRAEAGVANAFAGLASRLVVAVGELISDELLATVAKDAAAAGIPVEWELRGRVSRVPALVDRVIAISEGAGLVDFLLAPCSELPVQAARLVAARLAARDCDAPIVLRYRRQESVGDEAALIAAAVDLGAPLCDGIGDVIALAGFGNAGHSVALAYRILQGARLRTSWTEFISCPSCGRTLFDLEETTARIKERTQHLRGVKIAIMGCIVNGPGEMADADFGYVGSGPGTVNLYVGRELVVRNVAQRSADDRLVDLIREHGRWADPA